jgi:hypothetical protein
MAQLQLIKAGDGYKPNWNDPRNQKRLASVLEWCADQLHFDDGFYCNSATITKVFGPSGNSFAKYLRDKLLVQYGKYVPGTHPYTYKIDLGGYESLIPHLNRGQTPMQFTADHYREKYAAQLSGSEPIEYIEKADRLWHPLINLKRDIKAAVFKGYLDFDYDISAAAPTILFQLMSQLLPDEDMKLAYPAIYHYTQHKQEVRDAVAADTGIEPLLVKKLITGVFNGIHLSPHYTCNAYAWLNYDTDLLNTFKEQEHIKGLIADVKKLWPRLTIFYNLRRAFYNEVKPVDKKKKYSIYFREERRIMDCVRRYLDAQRVYYLLEHDGFRANREIDLLELVQYIKEQTGYEIHFD